MKVRNRFDNCDYLVSVVPVQKRISIAVTNERFGFRFPPIKLGHIRLQAAVYAHKANVLKQIFSKPVLVVNLEDPGGRISRDEFSDLVRGLVENERMEELFDDSRSYHVFEKFGFESIRKDIWSLFLFRKIKNVFIIRSA